MPYDDIYPVIFQGLALNGFEVALSDTVGIDDRRKWILLFLFAKLVYDLVYIEKFKISERVLTGFYQTVLYPFIDRCLSCPHPFAK